MSHTPLTVGAVRVPQKFWKDLVLAMPNEPAVAYPALVLADAPSLYLRCGDLDGSAIVDLGSVGATPTVTGTVRFGVQGALTGDDNKAILCDGSTGFLTVPHSTLYDPNTGSVTWEVWLKMSSTIEADRYGYGMTVLNKRAVAGLHEGQYLIVDRATRTIQGNISESSGTSRGVISTVLSLAQWHHVVLVTDRSNQRYELWIDGVLVTTNDLAPLEADLSSTAPLYIGADGLVPTDFFSGSIDEVAIYPYALRGDRITQHYQAGIAPVRGALGVSQITATQLPGKYQAVLENGPLGMPNSNFTLMLRATFVNSLGPTGSVTYNLFSTMQNGDRSGLFVRVSSAQVRWTTAAHSVVGTTLSQSWSVASGTSVHVTCIQTNSDMRLLLDATCRNYSVNIASWSQVYTAEFGGRTAFGEINSIAILSDLYLFGRALTVPEVREIFFG